MKKSRVGTPISVGETTIIPLERETVRIHHARKTKGIMIQCSKEPIGIVVITQQGNWAIDISGKTIPLEIYIKEFDDLQGILDRL
ncbi:MAG: hypothetical protein SVO26_04705 [Chloroflexota bacterium]|nr:hypothetical protein [Chloroflexota bacterium]